MKLQVSLLISCLLFQLTNSYDTNDLAQDPYDYNNCCDTIELNLNEGYKEYCKNRPWCVQNGTCSDKIVKLFDNGCIPGTGCEAKRLESFEAVIKQCESRYKLFWNYGECLGYLRSSKPSYPKCVTESIGDEFTLGHVEHFCVEKSKEAHSRLKAACMTRLPGKKLPEVRHLITKIPKYQDIETPRSIEEVGDFEK